MNRLDEVFASGRKNLLNVYCTAGYPNRDSTMEVMLSLQKYGADMIEIGIPYSDPIADGPVIQESNMKALQNGMNMKLLFSQLEEIKEQLHIPVILMGYFNQVLQFGVENFCKAANNAGVSAVILPDLPAHEFKTAYRAVFKKYGLHFIFLVTPETSLVRMKIADELSNGFLYAVSSSATTGSAISESFNEMYFTRLKKTALNNPVLIGFGIKDKAGFDNACRYAAGAIVGSAYIKKLSTALDIDAATADFIRGIR